MLTKSPVAILVLGLVVGFLVAHAAPFAAPSALAQGGPHKWEHFCFRKVASPEELTSDANASGKQGWELVSTSTKESATLMCFKRPLP